MDFLDFSIYVLFCKILNVLFHLTANNFPFQLYKISAVLDWSSSSNLALVVLAPFEKWEINP